MNADDFRHFYEYHFTINRRLWDQCIVLLTDEQFLQPVNHSVGSVRNQIVHMMNIEDRWFSGLRGLPLPDFAKPEDYPTREVLRTAWDEVEANMRSYLGTLHDDMIESKPFLAQGDDVMRLWQVLIHVANHGTDHRAQIMVVLDEFRIKTFTQDYFHFIIGHI